MPQVSSLNLCTPLADGVVCAGLRELVVIRDVAYDNAQRGRLSRLMPCLEHITCGTPRGWSNSAVYLLQALHGHRRLTRFMCLDYDPPHAGYSALPALQEVFFGCCCSADASSDLNACSRLESVTFDGVSSFARCQKLSALLTAPKISFVMAPSYDYSLRIVLSCALQLLGNAEQRQQVLVLDARTCTLVVDTLPRSVALMHELNRLAGGRRRRPAGDLAAALSAFLAEDEEAVPRLLELGCGRGEQLLLSTYAKGRLTAYGRVLEKHLPGHPRRADVLSSLEARFRLVQAMEGCTLRMGGSTLAAGRCRLATMLP